MGLEVTAWEEFGYRAVNSVSVRVEGLRVGDRIWARVLLVLLNEPLNLKKYRKLHKEIHTNEVSDALLSYENSQVLDERAPKIAKDEQKLPRSARSILGSSLWRLRLRFCVWRWTTDNPELGEEVVLWARKRCQLLKCPAEPWLLRESWIVIIVNWVSPEMTNFASQIEPWPLKGSKLFLYKCGCEQKWDIKAVVDLSLEQDPFEFGLLF